VTHSLGFRKKVLSVKEREKLSFRKTAKRFDVGVASVLRWSKNVKPLMSRKKPAIKINMDALRKDIQDHPDAYQYERAKRLGVSQNGIWHAMRRLQVTYKKNSQSPKSRRRKAVSFL
jgi:transposase